MHKYNFKFNEETCFAWKQTFDYNVSCKVVKLSRWVMWTFLSIDLKIQFKKKVTWWKLVTTSGVGWKANRRKNLRIKQNLRKPICAYQTNVWVSWWNVYVKRPLTISTSSHVIVFSACLVNSIGYHNSSAIQWPLPRV